MSYKLLFITHNSNSVSHNFFKVCLQFTIPFKIPKCQTADLIEILPIIIELGNMFLPCFIF